MGEGRIIEVSQFGNTDVLSVFNGRQRRSVSRARRWGHRLSVEEWTRAVSQGSPVPGASVESSRRPRKRGGATEDAGQKHPDGSVPASWLKKVAVQARMLHVNTPSAQIHQL